MHLFRRLSPRPKLGPPERQYPVIDSQTGRLLGRVDLAYPDLKIAIEYHGRRHHNPRTAEHDEARQEGIVSAGWTVENTGLMS